MVDEVDNVRSFLKAVLEDAGARMLEDDCQSYLGSHNGLREPDGVLAKPIDPASLITVFSQLTLRASAG